MGIWFGMGNPMGGRRAASANHLDDAKWKALFHAVVEKLGWSADGCDVEEGDGGCTQLSSTTYAVLCLVLYQDIQITIICVQYM